MRTIGAVAFSILALAATTRAGELEKARAKAAGSGKPMMVVFRCVP